MSNGHIVVSRWLVGIIITIMLTVIPMTIGVIYNQGKQSRTIEYIADSVAQIKDIVKHLASQDIVLARHELRLDTLEREIRNGQETK